MGRGRYYVLRFINRHGRHVLLLLYATPRYSKVRVSHKTMLKRDSKLFIALRRLRWFSLSVSPAFSLFLTIEFKRVHSAWASVVASCCLMCVLCCESISWLGCWAGLACLGWRRGRHGGRLVGLTQRQRATAGALIYQHCKPSRMAGGRHASDGDEADTAGA